MSKDVSHVYSNSHFKDAINAYMALPGQLETYECNICFQNSPCITYTNCSCCLWCWECELKFIRQDVINKKDHYCRFCLSSLTKVIFTNTRLQYEDESNSKYIPEFNVYVNGDYLYNLFKKLTKYFCWICKLSYNNKNIWLRHLDKEHKLKICNICFYYSNRQQPDALIRAFTDTELKLHLNGKLNSNHVRCKLCNKILFDIHEYSTHWKSSDNHIDCQFCTANGQNVFLVRTFDELAKHYKIKHKYCNICNEVLANAYDLSLHKSEVHGKKIATNALVNSPATNNSDTIIEAYEKFTKCIHLIPLPIILQHNGFENLFYLLEANTEGTGRKGSYNINNYKLDNKIKKLQKLYGNSLDSNIENNLTLCILMYLAMSNQTEMEAKSDHKNIVERYYYNILNLFMYNEALLNQFINLLINQKNNIQKNIESITIVKKYLNKYHSKNLKLFSNFFIYITNTPKYSILYFLIETTLRINLDIQEGNFLDEIKKKSIIGLRDSNEIQNLTYIENDICDFIDKSKLVLFKSLIIQLVRHIKTFKLLIVDTKNNLKIDEYSQTLKELSNTISKNFNANELMYLLDYYLLCFVDQTTNSLKIQKLKLHSNNNSDFPDLPFGTNGQSHIKRQHKKYTEICTQNRNTNFDFPSIDSDFDNTVSIHSILKIDKQNRKNTYALPPKISKKRNE